MRVALPCAILVAGLVLSSCATGAPPDARPNIEPDVQPEGDGATLHFVERFDEEHTLVGKPDRWHWVPYAAEIWVNEAQDVPDGYGPTVLTLGRGANSRAHIALKPEYLEGIRNYEVRVLWTDRLVVGQINDSDFHVGVRVEPTQDMDRFAAEQGYEVEVDGDSADATNLMPEDGPTHFHLFARSDVPRAFDHARVDEFPPPVRNTWYWTRVRVVDNRIWAKTWVHGSPEPDWMLYARDDEGLFPAGTIRLGVWSGKAEVAYVEIRDAVAPANAAAFDAPRENGGAGAETSESGADAAWESALFRIDEDGRAVYGADWQGNRIPDFSYVGYRRGDVPIPAIETLIRLEAAGGDETQRIQDAIDRVAGEPADSDGFRGAVELGPGVFEVSGTIEVDASGVVLRGAGPDAATGTTIRAVGVEPPRRDAVVLGSGIAGNWAAEVAGTRTRILTEVLEIGDRELQVSDPRGIAAGDTIVIVQQGTEEWMEAIDRGGTGTDPAWTTGSVPLVFNRYVESIEGDRLTIDAPLYMRLDAALAPAYLYKLDPRDIVHRVGLEDLSVEIVPEDPAGGRHAQNAVALTGVADAWVRNVVVTGFQRSGVVLQTAGRVRIDSVVAARPAHAVETGYLYNFAAEKAVGQVLFTRCHAADGRHHFISNGMSWTSGIVFHRTTSTGAWAPSEGHRQWSMGLLFDGHVELDGPRAGGSPILLGLYNRGDYGSSHGWSAVNSVAWNVDLAGGFAVIQKPPLGQNFGIGIRGGRVTGRGPFDHPSGYLEGVNREGLRPESLYEAQLAARLGGTPGR